MGREPDHTLRSKLTSPTSLSLPAPSLSLGGGPLSISMPLSATVAELKAKIQSETSVGQGELRLIYAGRILKDGDTLASHCEQPAPPSPPPPPLVPADSPPPPPRAVRAGLL